MAETVPLGWRKLRLDMILFVLMVVVMAHKFTGDALHEWLSLGFYLLIVWHLCLNWDMVWGVAKRFFKKGVAGQARFNFVWNALMFLAMSCVVFSGILISRDFLPRVGIVIQNDGFMSYTHKFLTHILFAMIGVHLGMHWRWLVMTFRRFFLESAKPAEKEGGAE